MATLSPSEYARMRYECTDEFTAKMAPNTPRPTTSTAVGDVLAGMPSAIATDVPASSSAKTNVALPSGAWPRVQRRMSAGAADWMAP
jgi:hypothetical protein